MKHDMFNPDYETHTNKRPLVLWSGGVDSTYLIWGHLGHGRVFDTVSADSYVAPEKLSREMLARKKIQSAFLHCEEFGQVVNETAAKSFRSPVMQTRNLSQLCPQGENSVQFRQVMPWIAASLMKFNPEVHSRVEVGYLMGDDISAWLHDIAETFYYLGRVILGTPVECYFPLATMRKGKLMSSLHGQKIELGVGDDADTYSLLDLTWVCELPHEGGHCGHCGPCKREAETRTELGIPARLRVSEEGLPLADMVKRRGESVDRDDVEDYFANTWPGDQYPQLYRSRPWLTTDEAHQMALDEDLLRRKYGDNIVPDLNNESNELIVLPTFEEN